MHRFSQFPITLPIVAPLFLPLATKPALAETAGNERALELLAKFAATVLKVMKSAEARANYQICNGVGKARVRSGLAEVASC